MTQSSATKSARAAGGDTAEEGAGGDSISLVSQVTGHVRSREPPQFERAVVSRTRFHISLPASTPPSGAGKPSAASEVDQRGWSSPHGEPYRPLGRPELNLKFSPQLVYGVTPMMQNAHRVQGGGGVGGATGTGNSDKDKELREPSSCTTSGASITTLADQFVASLTSRKRPLDDRQIKLAHRLQANAGGFSPEKVRGIYRRKPDEDPIDATGEQPHLYQTSRADASLQLLREAIEEGTSRLRSTRNGTNFLQKLPPSDLSGFQALHEQYLRARLKTPHSVVSSGSVGGVRTNTRIQFGSRVTHDDAAAARHASPFNREEDDGQGAWYLPYTTRQLQRSPHRRLPSLGEFRLRTRDEKQPSRPLRASSNIKSSPHRMRASASRSNHASLASVRSSMAPTSGALNAVGESGIAEPSTVLSPFAISKIASSPFAVTITGSQSLSPSVPPLHSIEKLQAAVDALEVTKCQQSARLATALEILHQDRHECLAGKFRSLQVRCDAVEDLRRMRELSERDRGQRVLAVVTKTADWYPDLLRRLLGREVVNISSAGAANSNTSGLAGPHAAELFIAQAVRQFTNDGCEFQSTQLFQVILYLHHDDLELLQVKQLLVFLRNALRIDHDEWTSFFASHGLAQPTDDFAGE